MIFVYTMSVSPQTALSTSTRRLTVHILIVHAMTIHPRNIIDAGSYETLCEVDSSSGDLDHNRHTHCTGYTAV